MDLIVYPTPQLVMQHKIKKLGSNIGHIGSVPITFDVFVENIIKNKILHFSLIGDFRKDLLIYYITEKLKSKKKLTFFKKIKKGYVVRIGELIGELKRQDISFKDLTMLLPDTPKNRDIILIYRYYQKLLKENNLYDKEDRYLFLRNYILKNEYISNYNKIIFSNFYGFTPIQQKIIDALGDRASVIDDSLNVRVQNIEVAKARDRRTEVWNLFCKIEKDLASGIEPSRMCVVLREKDFYAKNLFKVTKTTQIPVNINAQAKLIENPFIKAFIENDTVVYFDNIIQNQSKLKSVSSWAKELKTFLSDEGFPEKFCNIHSDDLTHIKRDVEAYNIFIDLLNEIEKTDTIFSDYKIPYNQFKKTIQYFIKFCKYNPYPTTKGIWVLSPTMLRGLSFDKIYVLGMIDGEFPRAFKPDWVLKDEIRSSINQKGYSLDTLDILLKRERKSFDFTVASSENAYFSYPVIVEGGKPTLISTYLEDLVESKDNLTKKTETVDFSSVFYLYKNKSKEDILDTGNERYLKQKIIEALKVKPLSVTALNTYGECPYKFFLSKIANLSKTEEERYTALERGVVCHKVLELFFKKHKGNFLQENIDLYRVEIELLTSKVMTEKSFDKLFPHPRLYKLELKDISLKIAKYIDYHIKNCRDLKPLVLEFGFGYSENFSFDFLPDVKFCGKIDRIDINPEGKIIIYDYKSNSTPDIHDFNIGTNIQMPFYILAGEKLFNREVLGGAFISIKKGKIDNVFVKSSNLPFISKNRRKGIFEGNNWDKLIESTKETILTYVERIKNAYFPVEPKKCPKLQKYGAFCDFINICPLEGKM